MILVSFTSNSNKSNSIKTNQLVSLRSWMILMLLSLSFFCGLTTLKFYFEHDLSPSQSGFGGIINNLPFRALYIGSSHTKQAIDISKVESITNYESYLLAYNGLDPTSIELILNELTPYKHPQTNLRLLIVEVYVFAAARNARLADTKFFSQAPPTLKIAILNKLVHVEDHLKNFKKYYELIVSNNVAHILFFSLFNPALDSMMYKGSYRARIKEQINSDNFVKVKNDAISYGAANTTLNHEALKSISQIIEIANTNNLYLSFHETPMPEAVMEIPAVKSSMLELKTFIENKNIKYYNFGLDKSFPTNKAELFVDWNHLSSQGRDLYSQMLADKINQDFHLTLDP